MIPGYSWGIVPLEIDEKLEIRYFLIKSKKKKKWNVKMYEYFTLRYSFDFLIVDNFFINFWYSPK